MKRCREVRFDVADLFPLGVLVGTPECVENIARSKNAKVYRLCIRRHIGRRCDGSIIAFNASVKPDAATAAVYSAERTFKADVVVAIDLDEQSRSLVVLPWVKFYASFDLEVTFDRL
jgi:hypothetical protein